MSASWKLTAYAPKPVVQAALLAHDDAWDWDDEVIVSGREVAEDKPDDWVLECWFPRKPTSTDRNNAKALFAGRAPIFSEDKLPETDWVTVSQQGVEPIRAGRFHVHTPEFDPDLTTGIVDLTIPASQAFGTGQHNTTAGCLAMLDLMKREGVVARDIADIGTGTGLLAFAALALWSRAKVTATDIDAVCVSVIEHNATANTVKLGSANGELIMIVAPGTDHPLIAARAPFDLLIANILSGPLIELAPDFAAHTVPGGHVLLAGLLETQEPAVRRAYRKAGFRLARRHVSGDWSILWLRKRRI
ncbi:MAG: methyltransferase [Erythrobacter sp.]|nr:methyltransferase [Erythrobacter sp.]